MPEQHIEDVFEERARAGDGMFAVAYALMQVSREQKAIAYQIGRLGLGDAASNWGAIELLSKSVSDAGEHISRSLSDIAERE